MHRAYLANFWLFFETVVVTYRFYCCFREKKKCLFQMIGDVQHILQGSDKTDAAKDNGTPGTSANRNLKKVFFQVRSFLELTSVVEIT